MHHSHLRGSISLATLMASIVLAATGSFFPTAKAKPTPVTQKKVEISALSVSRTISTPVPNMSTTLFPKATWNLSPTPTQQAPKQPTSRSVSTSPPSNNYFRDIIVTFTAPFESISQGSKKTKSLPVEQFFRSTKLTEGTAGESGTGGVGTSDTRSWATRVGDSARQASTNGFSTCSIADTNGGIEGCAISVSLIAKSGGVPIKGSLANSELDRQMQALVRAGKARLVTFEESVDGDIITGAHAGIVLAPGGKVIGANSSGTLPGTESTRGNFVTGRYDNEKWLKTFSPGGTNGKKNPPIHIYHIEGSPGTSPIAINSARVTAPTVFSNQLLTHYFPTYEGDVTEGGVEIYGDDPSRATGAGWNGRTVPFTAQDYWEAMEAGTPRDQIPPVTAASDKNRLGELNNLESYTFSAYDADGVMQTHTITDLPIYNEDIGSAVHGDHLDIATQTAYKKDLVALNKANGNTRQDLTPLNDRAERQAATGNYTGSASGNSGGGAGTSAPEGIGINMPANVGAWVEHPQCYKHMGGPGGSNQYNAVLTCNSGYMWSKTKKPVPIFVKDCGRRLKPGAPTERGCIEAATTQAGQKVEGPGAYACLWLACKKGNNAIYDPQSKICGCDDGAGGGFGSGLAGGAGSYDPSALLGGSYGTGGGDGGGGTGSGTRVASGIGHTDAENRAKLEAAGIKINNLAPKTNLGGLSDVTVDNLIKIKNDCGGCEIMITGGTEDGHATHEAGRDIVDIRFRNGSAFNTYIASNATQVGRNYYLPRIGGGFIRFYDEPEHVTSFGLSPRHWHTVLDSDRHP